MDLGRRRILRCSRHIPNNGAAIEHNSRARRTPIWVKALIDHPGCHEQVAPDLPPATDELPPVEHLDFDVAFGQPQGTAFLLSRRTHTTPANLNRDFLDGLLERHFASEVATGEAAGRDFAKRRRLRAAAGDGVTAAWMEIAA